MTATPFDYNEPLPDLHIIRQSRSWEPAARHYRDLTEAEKAALRVDVVDGPGFEADK